MTPFNFGGSLESLVRLIFSSFQTVVHGIPSETPLLGETGWGGEMGEERESQSQGQEISSSQSREGLKKIGRAHV